MQTVANFITNTPIYVYFILLYLAMVSIKSMKRRVVSLFRLLIITAIFIYLSVNNILKFSISSFDLLFLGLALLFFGNISWKLTSAQKIQIDKKKKLISLPGSLTNMIILSVIFVTKYYIGFLKHQNIYHLDNLNIKYFTIFSSAFTLGFSLGRITNYIYRFKSQDHVSLVKN